MFYSFLSMFIFFLDSLIKRIREENPAEFDLCNESISITTYHNKGAFLNLGEKYPQLVKYISLSLTLILVPIFIFTLFHHGTGAMKLGLAFLLGGAFSNTYDRLQKGYVVDYMNFPKAPGKLRTVIFNLSDFAIIIGALIIALRKH